MGVSTSLLGPRMCSGSSGRFAGWQSIRNGQAPAVCVPLWELPPQQELRYLHSKGLSQAFLVPVDGLTQGTKPLEASFTKPVAGEVTTLAFRTSPCPAPTCLNV